MNVYEIRIWRTIKHGGEFSHTATRLEIVHALNEERALKKITLASARHWYEEFRLVEASEEYVYSINRTGTVTIQPFYVYSDGRTPQPVKAKGDKE